MSQIPRKFKEGDLVWVPAETQLSDRCVIWMGSRLNTTHEPSMAVFIEPAADGWSKILYKKTTWFVRDQDIYSYETEN